MKNVLIVLLAAFTNVGTVICLKKAKFALVHALPSAGWIAGIALTIVTAQYLMCWADVRGASLGLIMSCIIVLVMLSAVLMQARAPSGKITLLSPTELPPLEGIGYGLTVTGIFIVGISRSLS
ncbi:hypothetical protein [Pontiella agarivorans]|uniref:Uncharacterized protein n=1 Tax=Pontiella agarivorans TaxID=3038953 RepID=A0ABU5N179_9BACT|nr:hypothetical protein [Pontiella agarivorans]MDZ8120201.1 hypothetical protein [Pontiella agarivorans]